MNSNKRSLLAFLSIFMCVFTIVNAQIEDGVYFFDSENESHELKIDNEYFIYTTYEKSPSKFIRTLGGFAQVEKTSSGENLMVLLEFNSAYEKDSVGQLSIPMRIEGEKLYLNWFDKLEFELAAENTQDLDGQWLFATRGPDEGQDRRGEANTRKTLKFLVDGRFQWIAYDTDGMQFKGTGGGSYTSMDSLYTENIEFFSKDDSRVGASLEFNYEIKGEDWHHTGNNSKGKPMYEIWGRRDTSDQ